MELRVADTGSRVTTVNLNQRSHGQILQEILRLAYLLEMGQASPSSQVSAVVSSVPRGVNAAALVQGALYLAPQLVAAGKGVVAALTAAGPPGWIAAGVVLSVAAFFAWHNRLRRQFAVNNGVLWWELEQSGSVQGFIRQCFTSSYFPRFSGYWGGGDELQVYLNPLPDCGRWTDLGLSDGIFGTGVLARDNVRKRIIPYAFLPLTRRTSNHQQIGALYEASSIGLPDYAFCAPRSRALASIIHHQSYENAIPQFFAATLVPSDPSLFRDVGASVGPKVRDLMIWSMEYASPVSDRLAMLEDRGFPVRLFSPGDADVSSYEHFAKSATLAAIAFWPGAASHGKVSVKDYEEIWTLGFSHSYRHNGRAHGIRTAAGVYLLCLSAAAAGIDLVIIEDFLARRRDDIPVSVISGAIQGSVLSRSGLSAISTVPIYSFTGISLPPIGSGSPPSSGSPTPSTQSPGSSDLSVQSSGPSTQAPGSSMSSGLIALAASLMAFLLFRRRRRS